MNKAIQVITSNGQLSNRMQTRLKIAEELGFIVVIVDLSVTSEFKGYSTCWADEAVDVMNIL